LIVGSPHCNQIVQTTATLFTASIASAQIYNLEISEYLNFTPITDCLVFTLYDPDTYNLNWNSESFGKSVSINNAWAAVGSPSISGSQGMVYVYRYEPTSSLEGNGTASVTWSFFQKLEPSGALADAQFGYSIKLNKCAGSTSHSMIIGCGNPYNTRAYYFEFYNGKWNQTYTFIPDKTPHPMTFGNYLPYELTMSDGNWFGKSVSLYGDTVTIGEPYDRSFKEYSGSSVYRQGSAYIFERCPRGSPTSYTLPKSPNSAIQWTIAEDTISPTIIESTITPELYPHATIKVNNKLYCGGWGGKIYRLNNPDNNLSDIDSAICNAGTGISAACYSEITNRLYFMVNATASGSIISVNPNNLQDQQILVRELPPYKSLLPLCTDGNYLYTAMTGSYPYAATILKIDIVSGATVASNVWISGSNPTYYPRRPHASVMDSDNEHFYITTTWGHIAKVKCSDLSYITTTLSVDFPVGPFVPPFASITDDIAYSDGFVYASVESGGNIFKISGSNLDFKAYPVAHNSYGVYAYDKHVYLLAHSEIWVYLNGDLDGGPIRFNIPLSNGCVCNELWKTDGGKFVYTEFVSSGAPTGKITSCLFPESYELPAPTIFRQALKTYGNENILKNNCLGWSVEMFGEYIIVGSPKTNVISMSSSYIGGTLEQLHQCNSDLENLLCGQAMLMARNTSSSEWDIVNIYQKKKKYLSPYRSYGFDVGIADKSMVVGAPLYLCNDVRQINITTTASNNVVMDSISGKAYIYNLNDLRSDFHVGNVFYRNGKIVIMTSGSAFDGLFFNPPNTFNYEYDLEFKSSHTIFEKQVICTVNPGEFNVSTNPTALLSTSASLDVNKNGWVDFQDVDIILRYMQYKNTSQLGVPVTTDWSSSVVVNDDEKSLLRWYQEIYDDPDTSTHTSESIYTWETQDTQMQDVLDLNDDNKIDVRDMNIMWKYFANRLTQENYAAYITPSCKRKLFSDVVDYMDYLTRKSVKPHIDPQFMNYEQSVALDKTGSFLAPMATTIGLYSGLDLVVIAKLGSPIKITPELPINFVVKMDF
jgi:hypothetical protein